MVEKIVRYKKYGKKFEILVDKDNFMKFKQGKIKERERILDDVLIGWEVYRDVKKGERPSEEELRQVFGSKSIEDILLEILEKGEYQLDPDQIKKMKDQKLKEIIYILSREGIDARTNLPIPPQRIENALEEIDFNVDIYKPAEAQIDELIKKLRTVLPIKIEKIKVEIVIPAIYASRIYGYIKQHKILQEQWLEDGSLRVRLEIAAGLETEFINELNKYTKGDYRYIKL